MSLRGSGRASRPGPEGCHCKGLHGRWDTHVTGQRYLLVTADDFGIGPATSRAILELAAEGLVTSTVLLVNSPHAADAVRAWRQAGRCPELGWHPCLTLDGPVAPPERVPTLLGADGRFRPLGAFSRALARGQIRPEDIATELQAQYERYHDLVGAPPTVVNSHHHVQVFSPVGAILRRVLAGQRPAPYVRRVGEPMRSLVRVRGARIKRAFLSVLGRRDARALARAGFPGNDWLAGVTDPPWTAHPDFLARWLRCMPGRVVELTCHPGHRDLTLVGRDCTLDDGQLERRTEETRRLREPGFVEACRQAGLVRVAPSCLRDPGAARTRQAA